ncbi:MAG: nicotinate-nucleotide--dimethylbenzimidazole phosphoribosyltransferase [Myxococcota bacterium]
MSSDLDVRGRVRAALDALAKPPGSLARLEDLAVFLGGAQRSETPCVEAPHVLVFAADHGVAAAHAVSAYPSTVTPLMVRTMREGRAAVAVLAAQADAPLWVTDVGVAAPIPPPRSADAGVRFIESRVRPGSADLVAGPALSPAEVNVALDVGRMRVRELAAAGGDLIALGELGIGNTTAAAALAARLLRRPAAELVGPGTGLDDDGVRAKALLVDRALARDGSRADDAEGALADLGGLELAAMVGVMLEAEERDVPVLLDGFVVGAAALTAVRLRPGVRRVLYPATRSAEPGHARVLAALDLGAPLFDAGFRLGEASGAALALPICAAACALLRHMARLAEVLE